jgi:nitronate monooxygenase
MNFGSGGDTAAKAWKDIWGSGQGIGAIETVETVADRVASLSAQYRAAVAALNASSAAFLG